MLDITIHRGSSQIGGCCTEISTGKRFFPGGADEYGMREREEAMKRMIYMAGGLWSRSSADNLELVF